MANSINATSTGNGGIITTGDDSGVLNIQTNETTAISIDASQNMTFTNPVNLPNTFGFKNRLINGNFDVWQRGTSSTSTGYTCADRWKFDTLTNVTASQGTASAPYGTYYLNLNPSNATNVVIVAQTLESNNLVSLKGSSATFSFQGNCASGTVAGVAYIQKSVTANNSAAGDWVTVNSQNFTLTTSVQSFSFTGAIPNDSTAAGLRVAFSFTNTANGVAYGIWGCQLEKGTQATSFDFRPYGTELALCQRYCYVITTAAAQVPITNCSLYQPTYAYGVLPFPTQMRTTPTTTFVNPTNWNVTYSGTAAAVTISQGQATQYATELIGTGSGMTTGASAWFRSNGSSTNQIINSSEL